MILIGAGIAGLIFLWLVSKTRFAWVLESHSAQGQNVLSKLTRDDRFILAVQFKSLKLSEFSMPKGWNGKWGYLSLATAHSRVSRMVDLGVLSVTPQGLFKLTGTGEHAVKHISEAEASPEEQASNLPIEQPLDSYDRSIWWAFAVPIFFLLILASPMALSDTAQIIHYVRGHFYVVRQVIPIPEGSILIGRVDLQQGPQVPDGKLLIQVKLQNNWDQAIRYKVTRISFMFKGVAMSDEPASVAGTLFKNDDIFVRMARVPSNMLVGISYAFKLSYQVFYGPAQGQLQWLAEREMLCTVPSTNFNIGACTYSKNTSVRLK